MSNVFEMLIPRKFILVERCYYYYYYLFCRIPFYTSFTAQLYGNHFTMPFVCFKTYQQCNSYVTYLRLYNLEWDEKIIDEKQKGKKKNKTTSTGVRPCCIRPNSKEESLYLILTFKAGSSRIVRHQRWDTGCAGLWA